MGRSDDELGEAFDYALRRRDNTVRWDDSTYL